MPTTTAVRTTTAVPTTAVPTTAPAAGSSALTDHTHVTEQAEATTRHRILSLIAASGPVSVLELAQDLDLTAAGVRRHVAALEDTGQVAPRTVAAQGRPRRGRPARRFVVTDRGQAALSNAYSGLATQALDFLAQVGGARAVEEFAAHRVRDLEARLVGQVPPGAHVADRTEALALALAEEGYAASARPVPGGRAVQLCQGHCPVQDVAARYPQLCEAETQMFSRVLGVHVQRLSTLAAGGHVCTTHVPTGVPRHDPAPVPGPGPVAAAGPDSTTTTPDQAATDRPATAGTVEGSR